MNDTSFMVTVYDNRNLWVSNLTSAREAVEIYNREIKDNETKDNACVRMVCFEEGKLVSGIGRAWHSNGAVAELLEWLRTSPFVNSKKKKESQND